MNGEKPPFERRRPPFNKRRITILMLPDDLILNCLARVSRLYYPTLSLVSKRFRSFLASTELYQTRSLLGRTENCLYVCLQLGNNSNLLRWFTLCRRPNSSNIGLVPISFPNSPSAPRSAVAIVGPNIYVIGGKINKNISSSVMVIDCRSHTSHETPSMQVPRVFPSMFPSVCVLDGKIYVTGGNTNLDSTNWMEVFDTKTQTWEFLSIASEELCGGFTYESVEYEGTVYVKSEERNVTYKLNKGRWRMADLAIHIGWSCASSYCVINNIFYRYSSITIDWYDPKDRLWKTLKGLERLPTFPRTRLVKLADYGGKMAVLWEEYLPVKSLQNKTIWCAEVTIERCQNGDIRGTLDWFDVVSTTNEPYSLVHALATNI